MLMTTPLAGRSLEGLKDVTRRPAKREIADLVAAGFPDDVLCDDAICPFGQYGDRLYIREAFRLQSYETDPTGDRIVSAVVEYRDGATQHVDGFDVPAKRRAASGVWMPGIHMWRWASRLTVELVSVRLERLHWITAVEVVREGLEVPDVDYDVADSPDTLTAEREAHARDLFRTTWDSIYTSPHQWSNNPLVWRLEYRRTT